MPFRFLHFWKKHRLSKKRFKKMGRKHWRIAFQSVSLEDEKAQKDFVAIEQKKLWEYISEN